LISGATSCTDSCGAFKLKAACDGPEDCPEDNVCCVNASQGGRCTAIDACPPNNGGIFDIQYQLCNTTADCPAGSGCCESTTIREYVPALDVGTCQEGCNLDP
jgi:hypothetical protein